MLYYIILYYVICYAMLCYAMLCYALLCHAMPCHAMSCHVMSCHVMSCHVMSCHIMSCHVILCYVREEIHGLAWALPGSWSKTMLYRWTWFFIIIIFTHLPLGQPELAAMPSTAAKITVWLWKNGYSSVRNLGSKQAPHSLDSYCSTECQKYDFARMTYAIKNETTGLQGRLLYWSKALSVSDSTFLNALIVGFRCINVQCIADWNVEWSWIGMHPLAIDLNVWKRKIYTLTGSNGI